MPRCLHSSRAVNHAPTRKTVYLPKSDERHSCLTISSIGVSLYINLADDKKDDEEETISCAFFALISAFASELRHVRSD